jgi:adenylate cyclase
MSEKAPESRDGQPPTNPSLTVQPPPSGTTDSAPHNSHHVHAHHSAIQFRFLEQLKHRNVIRVGILYLVVCWLILDPVHVLFHMLEVPLWANRLVVILMAVGFPAVLLFAWVYEITPEGLKPTAEVEPHRSIRNLTGRRLNRAIVVVMAVALAYFAADKFWLSKRATTEQAATPAASVAPATTPAATAISDKSVAVLPFVDMSEKKDQEYFSDGLSEELINLLSQVPDLQVIARTSSFYFKGKSEDIPAIAQRLHVANILEGSVRKSGNTLRVAAQLVRADSGMHLWSQTYDRELRDVFKVQDDIAGAVVTALKVRLVYTRPLNPYRTESTEAYNYFLLGRQLIGQDDLAAAQRAIREYNEAIRLDPNYAAALAGLALAEGYVADHVGDNALLSRAVAHAEQAVERGPDLADAYAVRSYLRGRFYWDWARARADLTKALALDPGNAFAKLHYSALERSVGRLPESIEAAHQAIAADPLSAAAWDSLGFALQFDGQLSESRRALERSLEISPQGTVALQTLGLTELLAGRPQATLSVLEQSREEALRLFGGALVNYTLGHVREADNALDGLTARHSAEFAYQIAQVYAWRGDKDHAFAWLERAYAQHDGGLGDTKADPMLRTLHGDKRYAALLQKINLSD